MKKLSHRLGNSILKNGSLNSPYGQMVISGNIYLNGTKIVNGQIVGDTTRKQVPIHWIKRGE